MKPFKKSIVYHLIVLLLIISTDINASPTWGATGHRVIGKTADNYLKPSAKRQIKKLLKRQTLAFVSTYADEIKSDKRYNEFYTWHYINMPFSETYESSEKKPKGDLVSGINYCKNIIKDKNSSDDDKAFYLKLLIHLIGDLHQPMHVGLKEDRGGNDFKVKWHFKDTNLHKVWDTQIIESYNMSYTELTDNGDYLSKEQVKSIKKGSIVDWVNDTHKITKQIYSSVKKDENLRNNYSYQYLGTVRSQLQKGGIRLANVLNELF